ncbi:MAG TPA: DUF4124 domain-containing protein [Gammaproteobacteria bacterium]|nr:DUF4124 domain-containing protein [Gammaproteobacteria bacterium]
MFLYKLFFRLILVSSFFFMNSLYSESLYKWIDEDGQTHYSQKPPSKPKQQTSKINLKSYKAGKKEPKTFYSEHCENGETELCKKASKAWNKKVERKFELEVKRDRARAFLERVARQEEREDEQKRLREIQERPARAAAEQKRLQNEQLISDCRKDRDTYCDKGADHIREKHKEREIDREITNIRNNSALRYNNIW